MVQRNQFEMQEKEDIPYIKCQVSKKLAKELYRQGPAKEAQISPEKETLSSGYVSKLSSMLISLRLYTLFSFIDCFLFPV